MDFTKALTFPFEDKNWIAKTVIGGLAMIALPVLPVGYQVRVARNVIRHEREILPGAQTLGQIAVDGVMAITAWLLYMLPLSPFLCTIAFTAGLTGDSGLGGMLLLCVTLCISGFMIVFGLPLGAMYWMGVIHYGKTGNFSSFLAVRTLWEDVRANMSTMILLAIYWLIFTGIMIPLAVFMWPTCIGLFLWVLYAQVATGHMLGQAGRIVFEGGM